jgi:hypothetical protein
MSKQSAIGFRVINRGWYVLEEKGPLTKRTLDLRLWTLDLEIIPFHS